MIEINEKFKQVESLVWEGKNVFVTGRAGVGKSTLLTYLKDKIDWPAVVLAPTGVAAVNIGGQTIHSFFGFKPDITEERAEHLGKKSKKKIYRQLQTVIIDEISMVRADLLDCIDVFLRKARRAEMPFGGVQLVMFGDLFQLPPIVTREDKKWMQDVYPTAYFFSAKVMADFNYEIVELTKVYRQNDPSFIEILNGIRNRSISEEMLAELNQRHQPDYVFGQEENEICLTATNQRAEEINQKMLAGLPGKEFRLVGLISGEFGERRLPAPLELTLKEGAQIMLTNNDSKGRWINGSLGKVKKIKPREDLVIVESEAGEIWKVAPYTWEMFRYYWDEEKGQVASELVGSYEQFPMILAWAITIHKSQGKTFEKVVVDLDRGVFANGQLYVALSRCTSLEGLVLKQACQRKQMLLDWEVVKFLNGREYEKAEKKMSLTAKRKLIEEAIEKGRKIEIVYLKSNGDRSKRVIEPYEVGETEYRSVSYEGLVGFCHLRGEERVFRLDRILELKMVE